MTENIECDFKVDLIDNHQLSIYPQLHIITCDKTTIWLTEIYFFFLDFAAIRIMEEIKRTFAQCKKEKRAALIPYVTAGYPTSEETVEIMLGMEAGGAGKRLRKLITDSCSASPDLIELGLPFTDPIADGPTIQKANTQALKNGVTVKSTLEIVREARNKGLHVPILFMGYYNPLLSYGEEKILRDAKEAGVNGFIVVDLPPEEAIRFRDWCTKGG